VIKLTSPDCILKKLSFYLLAIVSLSAFLFTSCGGDEETTPPTIALVNPPSTSASLGASVSFVIQVDAPEKIESVTITEKIGANTTTLPNCPKTTGFNSATSDLINLTYTAPSVASSVELTFKVVDKAGKEAATTFSLSVAASAGSINTYTAVLMGNQNSTSGSFYATSTNTVYSQADAKTNYTKVDFAYANGSAAGNEFFVGAPADESVMAVYNNSTTGVQTWTARNQTTFKATTVTTAQFDAMTNDALITSNDPGTTFTQGTTSRIRAADTEVGDVFAFRTAAGKLGLAKVTQRSGSTANAGTITLTVKVQQ
jgi:hypothetical protein